MTPPLLRVQHLTTRFETIDGAVTAVNGVSFHIGSGETLGLVGESGCGKSVTALSLLRLVEPPGRITAGSVLFEDRDLLTLSEMELRTVRGARIGFVFQEPDAALDPVLTVGAHLTEAMAIHGVADGRRARRRGLELLESVGLDAPDRHWREFPHQLSGGMRQRVLIAMALACRPRLLIADEPTTALDVTTQGAILSLLGSLQEQFSLSLLLITHDLGVVAEAADRVAVMYAGRIVEEGAVAAVLRAPGHPYTRGLLESIPRLNVEDPSGPRRARLRTIEGTVASSRTLESSCAFAPRCPDRFAPDCETKVPPAFSLDEGRTCRCFLYQNR